MGVATVLAIVRRDHHEQSRVEADACREGYDVREGEIKPNVHREPHTHDWDARLFVLDGTLTLVHGNGRETFGPGRLLQPVGKHAA